MLAAFLLAGLSIIYELNVAKVIASLTGNPVVWETLAIGMFIFGMGWGSFRAAKVAHRDAAILEFNAIEQILALLGAVSIHVLLVVHVLYRMYLYPTAAIEGLWTVEPLVQFGIAALTIPLAIGYFSGKELPLLTLLYPQKGATSLLASYYFGTLVGTLLFFAGSRYGLDSCLISVCCGLINLLVGVAVLRKQAPLQYQKLMVKVPLLAVVMGLSLAFADELSYLQVKNYYYNRPDFRYTMDAGLDMNPTAKPLNLSEFLSRTPEVTRFKSPYQTIDIVPGYSRRKGPNSNFTLYLDGRFQVHSVHEKQYHQALGFVPLALLGTIPQRVLILGGGDGLLARELLRHSAIQKIQLVELDGKLIDLGRTEPHLISLNKGSLDNPRVQVTVGDAYRYLKELPAKEQYDLIFVDFPYPYTFDSARLYSLEMFRLIKKHLTPEGVMALNSPVDFFAKDPSPLRGPLISSLHYAGLGVLTAYNGKRHHFLLAKSSGAFTPLPDRYKLTPTTELHFAEICFNGPEPIGDRPERRQVNTLLRPTFVGMKETFF